jgi:hypothetical protein
VTAAGDVIGGDAAEFLFCGEEVVFGDEVESVADAGDDGFFVWRGGDGWCGRVGIRLRDGGDRFVSGFCGGGFDGVEEMFGV